MDRRTPGYILREETDREKLRIGTAENAVKFEKKLEEGGGSELARRCLEEVGKRQK